MLLFCLRLVHEHHTDSTIKTTSSCMIYNAHVPNCKLVQLAQSLPLQTKSCPRVHCGIASRSVYPVKNEFSKAWIHDIKWSVLYWYYNVDKRNLINFIVQELAILIISLRCYKRDPARHAWQLKILTYPFINRTLISKSNCIQKSLIKGMLSSQAVGVLKCNDILIVKVF